MDTCYSAVEYFLSFFGSWRDGQDPAVLSLATIAPAPIQDTLDSLPPSYSQAEGLDQLPSYSDVEVSRMRFGPYVMVYDKGQKNMLTFKK